MPDTQGEYRDLIAELEVINRELVDSARSLPTQVNASRHWVTDLDGVIEKHRAATKRLRELISERGRN